MPNFVGKWNTTQNHYNLFRSCYSIYFRANGSEPSQNIQKGQSPDLYRSHSIEWIEWHFDLASPLYIGCAFCECGKVSGNQPSCILPQLEFQSTLQIPGCFST